MTRRVRSCAGFTLIEMIIVITLIGVLSSMVAVFIAKPVQGYVDSVRRAELTDQADVALRRITRDVHRALPNSLRLVANGFEFIMTKSGAAYCDPNDGSTACHSLFATGSTSFDALGPMPAMNGGDRIVVYNLGLAPADAYLGVGGNVATVGGVAGVSIAANPVPLSANPFPTQTPPMASPSARFQVVDRADLVVRYTCTGGELRRFSACTLATPSVCAGAGVLLAGSAAAEPKASCAGIDFANAALGRNGLLNITLTITDTPSNEAITLFQQIQVNNSP